MRVLTIAGLAHAPDGSGYYRFYLPYQWLGRNSQHITGLAPPGQQPPIGPADVEGLDVLACQRPAGPPGIRMLERLQGHVKLVYETDDDMLQVEPSGLPHLYDERVRDSIRRCLRLADMVTVSTPYLAEQALQFNDHVRVLPNFVKPGLLEWPRKHRDKLTVGWAGGTSHLVDMVTVSDELADVLGRNPSVDMHWMGFDFSPLVRRACRWTPWQVDVGEYYKQIDFDIAIAPLADVPFNQSKSAIRALEMAALGIPIVAADVLPYREFVQHGKTGFLYSTPEEFTKYLEELIHSGVARETLGAAAKEQARGWTIDEGWKLWQQAYEEVAGVQGEDGADPPGPGR